MFEIAVDTGNKQIKTEHFKFVSELLEYDTVPPAIREEDYFRFKGKYYAASSRRAEYLRDKSTSPRYFNLALFGIVKELDLLNADGGLYDKDKVYNIVLLVGLPPAHMENAKLKKNFAGYFRMYEPAKVTYKGLTWNVKICRVKVYTQCHAALMTIYPKIKDCPRVLGIDIGGFTSDYMMLERGRIDIGNTDSMEKGIIPMYHEIASECLKRYDAVIDEADVDRILQGEGYSEFEKDVIRTTEDAARRFTDRFLAEFREIGIDLKHCQTVFMGGGAILLKRFIESSDLVKAPIFIDDIHANARGYRMIYQLASAREGDDR